MAKAGYTFPVCSPAKWLSYHFLGHLKQTHPPLQSGIIWPKAWMLLKQVGEDISFQFSKLWARWEPGARALCSNTQTSTTGTLELCSTPGCGSCSTGSTCCASEMEWEINTNHVEGQCLFSPWFQSNIVPMSLGFSHSEGRAPDPPGGWSATAPSHICLKNGRRAHSSPQISADQWSGCKILWGVFVSLQFPQISG